MEFARSLQVQDDLLAESRRRLTRSSTRGTSMGRIPRKNKKPATSVEEPIVLSSDSEDENHADNQNQYLEVRAVFVCFSFRQPFLKTFVTVRFVPSSSRKEGL